MSILFSDIVIVCNYCKFEMFKVLYVVNLKRHKNNAFEHRSNCIAIPSGHRKDWDFSGDQLDASRSNATFYALIVNNKILMTFDGCQL